MKKAKSIFLVSCALALFGCNGDSGFWKNIQKSFENGATELFLKDVTVFSWSEVCVLPPYSINIGGRNARLKDYIPYDLRDYEGNIPNLDGDGLWAFAFIENEKVEKILMRGSGFGLKSEYSSNCINANKARLKINEPDPHGTTYLSILD